MRLFIHTFIVVAITASQGFAQSLAVTTTDNATTLANALAGPGITVTSATYAGAATAPGTYTGGPLGLGNGILVTSGTAGDALPPNDANGTSTPHNGVGDALCNGLVPGFTTHDAAKLTVNFTVAAGTSGIRLDLVAGSEEYPEFVGQNFNDVVGVFLDGTNIALDSGGNAITINGPFFSGSEVILDSGTEYDGATPRLTVTGTAAPGAHTLVIVVCDAGDTALDTAVFAAELRTCAGCTAGTTWCGDGIQQANESCDSTPGCGPACTFCGDGNLDPGEQCDASGESAACDSNCTVAVCGDQTPNGMAGEECDNGPPDATCDASCQVIGTPGCGNGAVEVGENCDDMTETTTCDANCTFVVCGDGTTNTAAGETCDTSGQSATCDADCTAVTCGDGTTNTAAGETCDTSGQSATCDANCTAVTCGDGTTNTAAGETCDTSGQSATCDANCTAVTCGDGTTNTAAGETCDTSGQSATCDANCTAVTCGDGTTNTAAGETCDTSGQSATCDADCTAVVCGDDTTNTAAGETCDDGNTTASDGCSATCTIEVPPGCGNGVVDTGEDCDDGTESAACDADCTAAACGDRYVNVAAGEQCEDGNSVGDDGCSSCELDSADADRDTVPDDIDNCPSDPNTDQVDFDNDGQGDACDPSARFTGGGGCSVASGEGAGGSLLLLGIVVTVLGRRRRVAGLLGGLLGMLLALGASTAHAQNADAQVFRPSPFLHDLFNTGTGETEGRYRWNIGAFTNYQNDPVVLRQGDTVLREVVSDQVTTNLLAAFRFTPWMALGLDIPIHAVTDGETLSGYSVGESSGVGDIRLYPRFRLYRAAEQRFVLAFAPTIGLPTSSARYMGRANPTFHPTLQASSVLGRVQLALNVGFMVTGDDEVLGNAVQSDSFESRFGARVAVKPDKLDIIAEVYGSSNTSELFESGSGPAELLAGVKWHAAPGLDVDLGFGAGLNQGIAAPDARVFAGVMWATDAAPRERTVQPRPEPVACSELPDPDGDGLLGDKDACPNDPEDFDGFEDQNGCPDADNDGDGVLDPWVTHRGQLTKYSSIGSGSDECPIVPEDKDGFVDEDGCPEPDNDVDRVCDLWVSEGNRSAEFVKLCTGADRCPTEAEVHNGVDDEDGCPDQLAKLESKKIEILAPVLFYFDRTEIKSESIPLLNDVVRIMKENPQLERVRIEGHTDERGKRAYNIKLSDGRSKAIMNFMIAEGIAKERLEAKGFGPTRPVVPKAKTDEDHQKNRRVEFVIVKQQP